ncbi:MAG: ComEC/Rec2 family competence protein [Victivallales bacterium]
MQNVRQLRHAEAASGIPFQLLHQPYHPAGAVFVFYEWNLLSILLNVFVIPLMGILMGGTVLLVLAGSVVGGIGEPVFVILRMLALPVKGILNFFM